MAAQEMINAGRYIVSTLEIDNVTRVFSVPGESALPVFDALLAKRER